MAAKRIGPITQAWYRWKAMRLPWRKRFLVGFDLQGNTYWEFRLTTRGGADSEEPWRRIVQYPRSTHYSSVKVSPLWHQWLRHLREAPSMTEQRDDVTRQQRMKYLAAEADARWEAKPKIMEAPKEPELLGTKTANTTAQPEQTIAATEDPWAKAKAKGPSEDWQPEAWDPTKASKK
ncbi:hypothetical protein VHEMI05179 [[Torrubiella] hemipterigena]|uniref:Uncharacterized protein n=1 Tax=[Torrubiella] hemipterigena TaxID=1531966 RepID=A0A0A1TG03_9HYPO|nr:hypothetical protein VHEMI05179 [[Torrubiella] hemipterigena]